MLRLNWEQHRQLVDRIADTPEGEWTHMVRGKKVRFERRALSCGHDTVFFRGEDYVGRWVAMNWAKEAVKIEPEQLTLF
ncbi:hypothetical protein ACPV3A_16540 [Paenibacillus sp. Dod16]|uniref:hypothetical protein n=1 Tax=Paenibacillus sp. Dod16 TaxID=3416392 RepID=UPI003CEEC8A9